MNYKKRNAIGFISFFIIIFFMINFEKILGIVNDKILSMKFIGVKGDKVYFSEFDNNELTKDELFKYISDNLKNLEDEKFKNLYFSIYSRNIDGDDNFIERFKLSITDDFYKSLYDNLEDIPINEEFLFKFVLTFNGKDYSSKIFSIRIVDELYKNERKIILNLDDIKGKGNVGIIEVPKYLKLDNNTKIDINAKYSDLIINELNAKYDDKNNVININNLVPLKVYSDIKILMKNVDGIEVNINIKKLLMDSENELQDYLSRVYEKVFNIYPNEEDYFKYFKKLSNHEITINDFLKNIILSEEFNVISDTLGKIVDNIYFLVNKKAINSELSAAILNEFNIEFSNNKNIDDVKLKILNKILYDDSSLEYIKTKLNLKVK